MPNVKTKEREQKYEKRAEKSSRTPQSVTVRQTRHIAIDQASPNRLRRGYPQLGVDNFPEDCFRCHAQTRRQIVLLTRKPRSAGMSIFKVRTLLDYSTNHEHAHPCRTRHFSKSKSTGRS